MMIHKTTSTCHESTDECVLSLFKMDLIRRLITLTNTDLSSLIVSLILHFSSSFAGNSNTEM